MKLDTLDALSDSELQAAITHAQGLLKQRDDDRKDEAIEKAKATLASVGLTLQDLIAKKKKAARTISYHTGRTYQHPANKAMTWNGKGKKPGWLVALEAEGGKAAELAS